MRNIKESPSRIDDPIGLANLSILSRQVSLTQSPHALLGCLAWDARCSLDGFGGCVGDCGRKAGGVLDGPGANFRSHCCCYNLEKANS